MQNPMQMAHAYVVSHRTWTFRNHYFENKFIVLKTKFIASHLDVHHNILAFAEAVVDVR